MTTSSITTEVVVHDGIGPVIGWMVATSVERVAYAMEEGSKKVEAYAKENAPWNDRTGAARDGLVSDLRVEDGGVIVLELAHSVDYGIWLETIEDGQFAIIMPTLEAIGPEILHEAGGIVTSTSFGNNF